MNGEGNRSWPDRLICLSRGRSLYIEFKRPKKDLTPGQDELQEELRALGHQVYTCTDAEQAYLIVEAAEKAP